jgi:hypothetical protein
MKMTRLPLLFCPLLACSPAQATMTMRVFAPDGGAARMVRLEAPSPNRTPPSVAEGAITLEMSVFPTAPGQAMRRVALEGLAAANAASGEPTAPIPGRAGAEALKLRLEAGLAARRDDLRWNIADGDGMPDVLSELTWREQKSLVLNARGEAEWPSGWLLAAEVGAGTLLKGEIQDSDYDGDGRAQEWSRTVGESDVNLETSVDRFLALVSPHGYWGLRLCWCSPIGWGRYAPESGVFASPGGVAPPCRPRPAASSRLASHPENPALGRVQLRFLG